MAHIEAHRRGEDHNTPGSMFASLTWPLVLGLGATGGFYWLLHRGPVHHPLVLRYFAGRPFDMIETALFFIGLAALILKLFELLSEFSALAVVWLDESAENQPASKASQFLEVVNQLPGRVRSSYLSRRLSEALESVLQRGSAEGLADELKYLSERDAGRARDSFALVRIVIWAMPMLGLLGTIVAITNGFGDLGRELLHSNATEGGGSLNTAMQGLLAGLYVAFDPAAMALCFSIALIFIQFMLDRGESQLLANVADRASTELAGRFEMVGASNDSNVQHMQQMSQSVIKAAEQLVHRQAELWQQSIVAAHDQWQRVNRQTTEQMQAALAGALTQSLGHFAAQLAKSEQMSSEQLAQRWEQWQMALSHNARLLHAQQQEMVKQGEVMTQAIRVTGDVIQLEKALNANLGALSGAKNFEDTVMSLAAAIHLLMSRLGHLPETSHVALKHAQVRARAA